MNFLTVKPFSVLIFILFWPKYFLVIIIEHSGQLPAIPLLDPRPTVLVYYCLIAHCVADVPRRRLVRRGSLDRIAHLCSSRLVPQALNSAVQTGIEQTLQAVRGSALQVAVYLTLVTLLVQLTALTCSLLASTMPPGLIFLLASLLFMCLMASKTIAHNRPQ